MFAKQKGLWLLGVSLLAITTQNNAQGASDLINQLPELRKDVHAVCPQQWESMYSRLLYIDGNKVTEPAGKLYEVGDDIWHANLADKSRYISYAYKQLITRENELTVEYASSDSGVILVCYEARSALIDTIRKARSEDTAAFFEQHVREFVKDDDRDGVFNLTDACPDDFTQVCISGSEGVPYHKKTLITTV